MSMAVTPDLAPVTSAYPVARLSYSSVALFCHPRGNAKFFFALRLRLHFHFGKRVVWCERFLILILI